MLNGKENFNNRWIFNSKNVVLSTRSVAPYAAISKPNVLGYRYDGIPGVAELGLPETQGEFYEIHRLVGGTSDNQFRGWALAREIFRRSFPLRLS